MNKTDLINAISEDAEITKVQSKVVLESLISNLTNTLAEGEKVTLVGFGTFSVAQREARKGRNPQTGAEIDIPAKKVVKFKTGSALKDEVN